MECIARISTVSNFLLVLYKTIVIFIYCQLSWKHTDRTLWKRLVISSLQHKYYRAEVLYEEATEEWFAQVDREDRNCIRLARQFGHLMKEYRGRFFTYVLFQSPTRSVAAHSESYLLHVYYTSQLDNLYDNIEFDQLELDWITWQRDYTLQWKL